MHSFLAALLLGALPSYARIAPRSETQALYHVPAGSSMTLVEDSYIVMFADDHSLRDHYINTGVNVSAEAESFSWFRHLNGYRAVIKNTTLVHELVRKDPGVLFVEHNSLHTSNVTFDAKPAGIDFPRTVERPRIGKRWEWQQRPEDMNWKIATGATQMDELRTMLNGGYGVNVYVVDSGVNPTDQVDSTRLDYLGVTDAKERSPYCPNDSPAYDEVGHGTACASIIGGKDIGVAPDVNIISVKNFCNGDSSMALTMQAFEDIARQEAVMSEGEGKPVGTIINFSQGWGPDAVAPPAFQQACKQVKAKGAMITAAAGNQNHDASRYVPQSFDDVYVIGNHGQDGNKYPTSNWGSVVDIWAPGENVLSADMTGKPVRMTGTSFAAPWVVGMAALIWSYEGKIIGRDVDAIWERITQNAIVNGVGNLPSGTTGLLFQTGANNPNRLGNPYAYVGGMLDYEGDPMDTGDVPDGGSDDEIL
ncbi:hypothetical protein SLS62_002011 [Diatrype stigma]|uniref:Peptidase S8/S53 domain-containing protein n=1 Tax=Diatrype stigma TaxID=117547 RepID=A0AAN9V9M2_9PEZI